MKHTSYCRREAEMKTKIREYRTAAKLTQQQLAEQVHVSSRTIISIEKEQYSPSLMLAYRIAGVFGVSVEELCCLKENKEQKNVFCGCLFHCYGSRACGFVLYKRV